MSGEIPHAGLNQFWAKLTNSGPKSANFGRHPPILGRLRPDSVGHRPPLQRSRPCSGRSGPNMVGLKCSPVRLAPHFPGYAFASDNCSRLQSCTLLRREILAVCSAALGGGSQHMPLADRDSHSWRDFGRICPDSEGSPIAVRVLAKFCSISSNIGRILQTLVWIWASFGPSLPRWWEDLAKLAPKSAELRPNSCRIWSKCVTCGSRRASGAWATCAQTRATDTRAAREVRRIGTMTLTSAR